MKDQINIANTISMKTEDTVTVNEEDHHLDSIVSHKLVIF